MKKTLEELVTDGARATRARAEAEAAERITK